jgi:glycosyltransferase involved in cell wall biosynthesis
MSFALNAPINSVSFGQVSMTWLRKLYERKLALPIFSIGGQVDLSTQQIDTAFQAWLQGNINEAYATHSRSNTAIKLWHLEGSIESVSEKQVLFSFYELDHPTKQEINVGKNNTLVFSSKYSCEVFADCGVESHYIPLGFDSYNFKRIEKKYFSDNRIVFNVVGKLEKRKRHEKTIRTWIKKFGNNPKYFLQCAIYNPFLSEKDNAGLVHNILEGKKYFNVNFLGFMAKNHVYNDFLNSGDVVIGTSGGEGWGLPEFHSVAMGKHAVIVDAHGYKGWATEKNSVLLKVSGKIDCYDGVFFKQGRPFSQGQIFDFNEDDLADSLDLAIARVEKDRLNAQGLKLQEEFTIDKSLDALIKLT